MNYNKKLKELDEAIEQTRDLLDEVYDSLNSNSNSKSLNSLISNLGMMSKMTGNSRNLFMGQMVENFGRSGFNNNLTTEEKLEKMSKDLHNKLHDFEMERKEVYKEKMEHLVEPNLIVENDSIFIDKEKKIDLLSKIKEERKEIEEEILAFENNEKFNEEGLSFTEALETRNKLISALKVYNCLKRSDDSEFYDFAEKLKWRRNEYDEDQYSFTRFGEFLIPNKNLKQKFLDSFNSESEEIENGLKYCSVQLEQFKPNFLGRIIPTIGKRQKNKVLKNTEEWKEYLTKRKNILNEMQDKFNNEYLEKYIEPYENGIKQFSEPYFDMLRRYPNVKIFFKTYDELKTKYMTNDFGHNVAHNLEDALSEEAKNYIDEHNINIKSENVIEASKNLNNETLQQLVENRIVYKIEQTSSDSREM